MIIFYKLIVYINIFINISHFSKTLLKDWPFKRYIVSGTPESQRNETIEILNSYGITQEYYDEILLGYEYDKTDMNLSHFKRMREHKLKLIKQYDINVFFDDNPFYKAAEHLFIGVSAGYWVAMSFWQQVQPNLFGRLWPKLTEISKGSVLKSSWYGIYEVFNFISTGFGLLDRSIFPEGGIVGFTEIQIMYIIPFILGLLI